MAIITSTVRVGQKIPKEVIKAVREAAKHPINYTPDCPKSSPEALAEFAALRAEQKKNKMRSFVALRVLSKALEKYKALGKGYTGIMADVLNYVADKPEILAKIHS
jgi:uncharacterized protein (DUF4415 family)